MLFKLSFKLNSGNHHHQTLKDSENAFWRAFNEFRFCASFMTSSFNTKSLTLKSSLTESMTSAPAPPSTFRQLSRQKPVRKLIVIHFLHMTETSQPIHYCSLHNRLSFQRNENIIILYVILCQL